MLISFILFVSQSKSAWSFLDKSKFDHPDESVSSNVIDEVGHQCIFFILVLVRTIDILSTVIVKRIRMFSFDINIAFYT